MDETLVKISPDLNKLPNFTGTIQFTNPKGRDIHMLVMFRPNMIKFLK